MMRMVVAVSARTSSGSKPRASGRRAKGLPACGFTLRGETCGEVGDHFCRLRVDKVERFFAEVLVHTKYPHAGQAFELDDWQLEEIVAPVFGTVEWSDEWGMYVRRYSVVIIEMARKCGKSELLARIALYLLVAEGVEAAEIYGVAKTRGQARKVWDVANDMRRLSPLLNHDHVGKGGRRGRCTMHRQEKKITDEKTRSYYQTVSRDAEGELGSNPYGVVFDEFATQPDGDMFSTVYDGFGTRVRDLGWGGEMRPGSVSSTERVCPLETSSSGGSNLSAAIVLRAVMGGRR